MKTNTLLTYLLYALLTGLIGVAGYKACQMKRDQARTAQENEEFQKTLRDLGYLEEDSTGSQYAGETPTSSTATTSGSGQSSAPATPAPAVSNDGIEDDPAPATTTATPKQSATTPKQSAPTPHETPPATTTPSKSTKSTKASSSDKITDLDHDSSDGRYRVVAGSFRVLDGARRQMEQVIKLGYHDAEIGYMNKHTYAVVVVKRTNSLNEANKIVDRLESKGIDASVVDRYRKK